MPLFNIKITAQRDINSGLTRNAAAHQCLAVCLTNIGIMNPSAWHWQDTVLLMISPRDGRLIVYCLLRNVSSIGPTLTVKVISAGGSAFIIIFSSLFFRVALSNDAAHLLVLFTLAWLEGLSLNNSADYRFPLFPLTLFFIPCSLLCIRSQLISDCDLFYRRLGYVGVDI